MNPLAPLVDDELALIQYLRGVAAVTSLVAPERITTQLDPNPTYPVVLLHDIGGYTVNRVYTPVLQVDTLGPLDRVACKRLALTVRSAVLAIANDVVPAGVLASASEETTPQWLPDALSSPPMPRFTARYRLILHP